MSDFQGDPDQPNQGYPYSVTNKVHKFDFAPGETPGIKLSRWHRKRKTPFGGEFDYTNAEDLTGRFSRPGSRWTRRGRMGMRWRMFVSRFKRQPVAWLTVDYDEVPIYEKNPEAYMMKDGECKISPIEQRMIVPIYPDYVDKAMFTMDGYERTQEKPQFKVVNGED